MAEKADFPTATQLDAQVADLTYEEAREQLVAAVQRLESGNLPLEEALATWEHGEALARRCQHWLDEAKQRLEAARAEDAVEPHESESDEAS